MSLQLEPLDPPMDKLWYWCAISKWKTWQVNQLQNKWLIFVKIRDWEQLPFNILMLSGVFAHVFTYKKGLDSSWSTWSSHGSPWDNLAWSTHSYHFAATMNIQEAVLCYSLVVARFYIWFYFILIYWFILYMVVSCTPSVPLIMMRSQEHNKNPANSNVPRFEVFANHNVWKARTNANLNTCSPRKLLIPAESIQGLFHFIQGRLSCFRVHQGLIQSFLGLKKCGRSFASGRNCRLFLKVCGAQPLTIGSRFPKILGKCEKTTRTLKLTARS